MAARLSRRKVKTRVVVLGVLMRTREEDRILTKLLMFPAGEDVTVDRRHVVTVPPPRASL